MNPNHAFHRTLDELFAESLVDGALSGMAIPPSLFKAIRARCDEVVDERVLAAPLEEVGHRAARPEAVDERRHGPFRDVLVAREHAAQRIADQLARDGEAPVPNLALGTGRLLGNPRWPRELDSRTTTATRLFTTTLLLTLASASAACAAEKELPPPFWPTRSVPIANELDVPFCGVAIGVDGPPSMKWPVVDYLESPQASRDSLARRVPAHGEGTVLIPMPPPGCVVRRYELGVLECTADDQSGGIIERLGVDADVESIRVGP